MALLQGISAMLIVSFNNYQSAVFFTSAGGIAGNIYNAISNIEGYFSLKDENNILTEHNTALQEEVFALRKQIEEYKTIEASDSIAGKANEKCYTLHHAKVVNNSLNKVNNYITIDKGEADGIKQQMGVICDKGVVGITYTSSSGFTLVLPLLNTKSNISSRINNSTLCSLQWDGKDILYSQINDLPRHSNIAIGDTVFTSGFSSIFPEGIPIGSIEDITDSSDGIFKNAKVRLFVDFSTISTVYVIEGEGHEEQEQLEKSLDKEQR